MSDCRHGVPLYDYCVQCSGDAPEPAASAEKAGEPTCIHGRSLEEVCITCLDHGHAAIVATIPIPAAPVGEVEREVDRLALLIFYADAGLRDDTTVGMVLRQGVQDHAFDVCRIIARIALSSAREAVKETVERCAKIADELIMLPADECNIPYSETDAARISGRSSAAKHIARAIRALADKEPR